MNAVGLSLTGEHGLSLTQESAYRKPEHALTHCICCKLQPLNYANIESFGFFLTAASAAGNNRPPPASPTLAAALSEPFLTHVELFWQERVREHWLRFGSPVGDRIIDRRRRVASFAPGAIFAFIRWAANDYGTVISKIDIVRAVSRGETYSTLPHVDPGGEILLHLHGWPKVEQLLCAIDAIEALGIAPEDVAPEHWRHIHNRVSAGLPPSNYSLARHQAWLLREGITP
jgi:Protein of unknown function (DUF2840)